jgi:hypothetical protein
MTNLTPAFTINAGESGKTAVMRLAAMVPDRLFMRGSVVVSRQVSSADATDYAYGTAHSIAGARYVDGGPEDNYARVTGTAVYSESFDFPDIEAVGSRVVQVVDRNLTTGIDATERADLILRDASLGARRDEVYLATVNTVQEVLDVVEVSDPQAGLSAARRRVRGVAWSYVAAGPKPRYDMTLTLGEV